MVRSLVRATLVWSYTNVSCVSWEFHKTDNPTVAGQSLWTVLSCFHFLMMFFLTTTTLQCLCSLWWDTAWVSPGTVKSCKEAMQCLTQILGFPIIISHKNLRMQFTIHLLISCSCKPWEILVILMLIWKRYFQHPPPSHQKQEQKQEVQDSYWRGRSLGSFICKLCQVTGEAKFHCLHGIPTFA